MKNDQSIDICFTFDTTGSMYPCLTQVRRYLQETVDTLFNDIQNLRIAVIAHGDYIDRDTTYVTKILDFTNDKIDVLNFINNVERTHGGDFPECYELVLHEARTKLNWKSGTSKIITMIGDAYPHTSTHFENTQNIDWQNELGLINEMNISVYGVHCMPGVRGTSKNFYQELARRTNGVYLTLDQFSSMNELFMGICYHQSQHHNKNNQFNDFVEKIQRNGKINRNLKDNFYFLSSGALFENVDVYSFEEDGLKPVPGGRFQAIPVEKEVVIRDFIEDQGIAFETGRCFYEAVRYKKKAYRVQQHKEIILQDKKSGDMFNGSQTREILGLLPQKGRKGDKGVKVQTLSMKHLDNEKYRIFIQSTSYNRKLVPGTRLMYEVKDD